MRILLVGGGSGGHVTPLKAIIEQLNLNNHEVAVVSDRGFFKEVQFLFSKNKNIKLYKIFAGKLRRYHSKSILWHITHMPTLLKNIRDIIYLVIGLVQSVVLLIRIKPDVIFCKGGFVCIPVALVGKMFSKRIIIHDSDTRPGLTNKVISRWAEVIATGMPANFYPYPVDKIVHTGIPVNNSYKPISTNQQINLKKSLGFSESQPVLLVTGGGNGAKTLNELVCKLAPSILNEGWGIIHITGKNKSSQVEVQKNKLGQNKRNWLLEEFTDMLPRILAADIIVTRTSASTLQECANAKKTVIGIPSPHLLDQNMNAKYFKSKHSILTFNEGQIKSGTLKKIIIDLYKNSKQKEELALNLYDNFAMPDSANQLAKIITG